MNTQQAAYMQSLAERSAKYVIKGFSISEALEMAHTEEIAFIDEMIEQKTDRAKKAYQYIKTKCHAALN